MGGRAAGGQAAGIAAKAAVAKAGGGLLLATAAHSRGGAPKESGSLSRLRTLRGRAALGAAVAHLCLGHHEASAASFKIAIPLRSSCGRTQFNRGVMHLVSKDYEAAEADLLQCVKQMPMNVEAWMRKSIAVVRQDACRTEAGRKAQVCTETIVKPSTAPVTGPSPQPLPRAPSTRPLPRPIHSPFRGPFRSPVSSPFATAPCTTHSHGPAAFPNR